MTDYQELKRLALASEDQEKKWIDAGRPWPIWNSCLQDFRVTTKPSTVLALVAELEALRQFILSLAEYDAEIANAYAALNKEIGNGKAT